MEEKMKLTFEIVNLFDMVERKVITFDKAKDNVRLLIEYCNVNQPVIPIDGENQPINAIYQAQKAIKNFNDALLIARDQSLKLNKSKQSWMQQILLRPLYLLLKKDMIRLLSKKHGEQFIDDVMQTFEIPTNLMDKYFKLRKNQ